MSWTDLVNGMNRCCQNAFSEKEGVIYIRNNGDQLSIQGIFDANFISVDPDTGATISSTTPVLAIIANDLPVSPDEGDKVVIRGVTYKVMETQPDSEGMIKLILHRAASV